MTKTSVYLDKATVRARYGGKSSRTIARWEHRENLGFPRAILINGRRHWKLSELESWECELAARNGFSQHGQTSAAVSELGDVS